MLHISTSVAYAQLSSVTGSSLQGLTSEIRVKSRRQSKCISSLDEGEDITVKGK